MEKVRLPSLAILALQGDCLIDLGAHGDAIDLDLGAATVAKNFLHDQEVAIFRKL